MTGPLFFGNVLLPVPNEARMIAADRNHVWLDISHIYDGLEFAMKFRLTYAGKLQGTANSDRKPDHVHEIRKTFHKQLKYFWSLHPILKQWQLPNSTGKSTLERTAENFARGNYQYAPLATEERRAIVSLDVLFLRSGEPGSIMKSADLDGRLKTLVDALTMPVQNNQTGKYTHPDQDEQPFYCLMEDDKLVGNIAINSDILLEPSPSAQNGHYDTHDSRIVVGVELRTFVGGAFGAVQWT